MESLTRLEHPVNELDWEIARENFYAAMRDGLEADLSWITNDGKETTDSLALYEDLLAHAEDGLTNRGLTEEQAAKYLYPLRRRVRQTVTPGRWKYERVRTAVDDGATLEGAIQSMQRRYVERQRETLLEGVSRTGSSSSGSAATSTPVPFWFGDRHTRRTAPTARYRARAIRR